MRVFSLSVSINSMVARVHNYLRVLFFDNIIIYTIIIIVAHTHTHTRYNMLIDQGRIFVNATFYRVSTSRVSIYLADSSGREPHLLRRAYGAYYNKYVISVYAATTTV